jgi:hypothetical protein
MTTSVAYTPIVDRQHYIVPMRMSSIVLEDAATAAANQGATLSDWMDVSSVISGVKAVTYSGSGNTFEVFIASETFTITNVARATGVVTLTFSANPTGKIAVGDFVKVAATTNTSVNGTVEVKTVTSTGITYDFAGSNITAVADTGSVTSGAYPLDGNSKPIMLNNITGAPFSTSTNTESIITHDAATLGNAVTVALTDSRTAAFKGVTVHRTVDHKILELFNSFGTPEQLAVKYLRVGPGGTSEKLLCYAQLSSNSEDGDGGTVQKFNATMTVLGRTYKIFDNTAA